MIIPQLQLMELPIQEFKEGDVLIEENSPGTSVYVLLEGEVIIEIEESEITRVSNKGAIFGEMSALLGRSRGATVKAAQDSRFYVIDDLLTFLRKYPEMSLLLLRLLAERVEKMNQQVAAKKKWWMIF